MSNEPPADEPKLIIDEDWKSQVQREKEQLKQQQQQQPDDESAPAAEAPPTDESSAEQQDRPLPPPPPASFEFLISGLATQAVAALGQLPDEKGQFAPTNLDYARHYIDLLGVIESKTQGNLSEHEQRFLRDSLHQLRLLYVEVSKT